jgi:hypothetical protein
MTQTCTMADSPDEVLAVAAEGGMLEEPGDELVVLHLGDVLLLQRPLPRSEGHKQAGWKQGARRPIFCRPFSAHAAGKRGKIREILTGKI